MYIPDLDVARASAEASPFYARRLTIELLLADYLENMVGGVALKDVAVPMKGQGLPRASRLARFGIVPLSNSLYLTMRDSSAPTSTENLVLPDGVRLPADPRSHPAMDTAKGIGLTYNDTLVAVTAAYVAEVDKPDVADLMIRQVQGFGSVDSSGHSNDGLNNGIDWRQTLVRAWGAVAQETPATTIGIHSAEQTPWVAEVGLRASGDNYDVTLLEDSGSFLPRPYAEYVALGARLLRDSYDDVARALFFTHMANGHWESPLPIGTSPFEI